VVAPLLWKEQQQWRDHVVRLRRRCGRPGRNDVIVQLLSKQRQRLYDHVVWPGPRPAQGGPRVPSIMELADETGRSPATVKRALKLLHDEGVIFAVPGRGTFVAKRPGAAR
jgi:hypothetical protein